MKNELLNRGKRRWLRFCILHFAFYIAVMPLQAGSARPSVVAGQFYPGDKQELTRMVDGFLAKVPEQEVPGALVAVTVPHAGYIFSGQVAAYSYKLLQGKGITTVILIGNSHHFPLGKGAVYPSGSFATPLGEVPVNGELAKAICAKTNLLEANTRPHGPEHSLEVQLPFLQRTLKEFSIVPILLGDQSLGDCQAIGAAVAASLQERGLAKKAIIIASSDMSHYPSWANANMTDTAALAALKSFDAQKLKRKLDTLKASGIPNESCVFCGEQAIYTTIYGAKALGADTVQVLKYANSGDVTGDRTRVVGYGAAAFTGVPGTPKGTEVPKGEGRMQEFRISEKGQKELLSIARQSIENYLKNNSLTRFNVTDAELTTPAAVFVTLTINGNLRGCIGTTEPQGPLYQAVSQLAIAAAVEDYRFKPLTLNELKDTRIEVSVLSPLERVKSADGIKQDVHGVVVRRDGRSGLFLPQVWEHFKTSDDFLNELCWQKAGLEPGAWKDPKTELYVFTVFAFEEEKK